MFSTHLYLIINLLSISIPLVLSFQSAFGKIYLKWKSLFLAITLTAIFFIIWDILFSYWGVWGFNVHYILGYYLFHLPLEEYLFFVCIPYACLFTYIQFKNFNFSFFNKKTSNYITKALIIISFLTICSFFYKNYTFSVSGFLFIFLIFYQRKIKVDLSFFYTAYSIVLIPFLLVNGLLTGMATESPMVWYNDLENLGLRIITIPIEDFFYYYLLFIINVTLYDYFEQKK